MLLFVIVFANAVGFIVTLLLSLFQVAIAYFTFMEVILSKYIKFAINLDANTLLYIVRSLHSGLKLLDSNITSQVGKLECLITIACPHVDRNC